MFVACEANSSRLFIQNTQQSLHSGKIEMVKAKRKGQSDREIEERKATKILRYKEKVIKTQRQAS